MERRRSPPSRDGILELTIGVDGRIERATLTQGMAPSFDHFLLEATRNWRYQPARVDGRPVRYRKAIRITFQSGRRLQVMPSRRAALAVIGALACASACARPVRRARRRGAPGRRARLGHAISTPGHVRPGENFGSLLANQQIGSDQLEAMLASLEGVFDPRRMHEGQAWRLLRTGNGQVRLFEYEIDGRSVLGITPNTDTAGEFVAEVVPYNVRVTRVEVSGNINEETSSLFAAMSSAGEQPDLSVALADIFSGEVDFNTDLQPGDSFHLITEKAVRDGRFVGYGPVAAAELVNEGRHLVAFRFQPAGAPPGYYDAAGRSLKRFFLRSPLKFDPQHLVRLLPQPPPSDPQHPPRASRRRLPRADRARRRCRLRWRGDVRGDGRAAAEARCASVTRADTRAATCTCRRSAPEFVQARTCHRDS